jgi:hypothetical protein
MCTLLTRISCLWVLKQFAGQKRALRRPVLPSATVRVDAWRCCGFPACRAFRLLSTEPYPTAARELQPCCSTQSSASVPTVSFAILHGRKYTRFLQYCSSWLSSVPPICRHSAPNWATASLHTLSNSFDDA